MKNIHDKSVDMILCDLPYGTTRNKWDSVINLTILWEEYNRIIKDNSAIILTAQTPFDKVLGCSNLCMLKYEWIWEKEMGTGHLNSNFAPLKSHENILIFSKASASYVKNKSKAMNYFPQMEVGEPYIATKGSLTQNYGTKWDKIVKTENKGERYPKTILRFNRDKDKLHPTQKPVALFEYLIRTYSNEGDVILDNCSGSGTTAISAINTNRKFILIEKDKKYFDISAVRIEGHLSN
ncbi:site-specific DNA-methyltransferase [Marivirga sp.]|uniref:DNA-methyltransferase n=1 Tax=Marivirga sp. TaxID=2018662 RepID=UPI002D7F2674|nr:site-specific DNA-methyltransferase [Marivirga sp.]HET8861614.1 site-specific DNA-methyltransferase [Marivirga sp.]